MTYIALSNCCTYRELSRYDRDQSFPEKKGYNPDVKLEYVDEKGRVLTTKEVTHLCACGRAIYYASMAVFKRLLH